MGRPRLRRKPGESVAGPGRVRVVLDTNIVLAAVSRRSPYRGVLDAWEQGAYELCVSTEVLLEYEEKLADNFGPVVADLTVAAFLAKPSTHRVTVFYAHRLIASDPDDDKFVNCALWANAHYLVTNDRHFRALQALPFPKLTVLTMAQFQKVLAAG